MTKIFYLLVLSALFIPPIFPGTSIRIDTILIYPFFLLLISTNFWRISLPYILIKPFLFFLFIPTGVYVALFLQYLTIPDVDTVFLLHNVQGFTRPLLFFIAASNLIKNYEDAQKFTRIILIGICFHGILIIFEYFEFPYVVQVINYLFRGDVSMRLGSRGLGAFSVVHGAAYFGVYSFVFASSILIFGGKKLKTLAIFAVLLSLFLVILPFSRAAFLCLAFLFFYFGFKSANYFSLILIAITLLALILVIYFTNDRIGREVDYLVYSIYNGVLYYYDSNLVSDLNSVGFITGRLEWGWANALTNWLNYPVTGNIMVARDNFIGDGGFTESLSNHGMIGLFFIILAFLCLILSFKIKIFWLKHSTLSLDARIRKIYFAYAIIFIISMLATGFLLERGMEILPVMFVCLTAICTKHGDDLRLRPGSLAESARPV